jgi:hypothetical protein
MIDFNTEPYNDDYDENQKFYRILFRPSFAVQARELTQLQTILQKQISRHGDHVFSQGAMVIPGQISLDTNAQYVKLQPLYNGVAVETFLSHLQDKTIVGSSGLVAEVIKVQSQETSEPTTIYVRYKNSGTNGTTKVFADGETISTQDGAYDFQAEVSGATGVGSIVTIERGVYYVNGHFVLVDNHSLILDKYTNTPSYRVGLSVTESVVTPEDEETLLDNAQNSYNFAAPGAHRFFIDLKLAKLPLDSVLDKDFIELLRTDEGVNQKLVNKTEYAELEKTMARRTYDESGDYTVREFAIDIREHRTNDRGAWTGTTNFILGDVVTSAGKKYVAKNSGSSVSTAPVHTTGTAYDGPGSTGINWEYNENPVYNRGIFKAGDDSKLAVGLEPGKAYVRGYEVEKIATEYVAVNKAREFVQADNAFITATVGNFIYATNVNNLPPINTFATVDLYNQVTSAAGRGTAVGTKVGTARVRFMDWDNGTIGSASAVYKTSLFDVKMVSGYTFDRHVKSIFYSGGSPAASFTADINPITAQLIGSITAAGTAVTGTGTSFQTDLIVGDYISVGGSLYRVSAIASQVALTLGAALTTTGSAYSLVKTKLYESDYDSLLFSLPYYAVKSLRSALGTNDTSYASYERFTGTTSSASGGTCALTVSTSSGSMASGAVNGNYVLTDNTTGNIILPSSISPSGSSVTFTLPDTYASRPFVVIGAVNKTGSTNTEKTKTLNSATIAFTTQGAATAITLPLGKSDAWRVVSVKMKSGTFASPGATYSIDISDRYDFDNGQRSTYYDMGKLTLKDTYVPPSAPVQVVFEYFTHSTGDYCSVNSYPAEVSYKEIPPVLRDSLDFRPRIDDAGSVFSGSGSATLIPKRGADVRTDFTYYLARKEKIAIDLNGNFFSISGTSSINPGEPEDPATGMVLYKLALEPFTFGTSSNSVDIKKIDNKRYTMRDIGKLEKRIDNLEYYTSLSLLEQETQNLKISDSTGLDRLKNGFIVDNFNGHGVGATNSPDYKCSVDMQKGELRPFYTMNNVNMIEKNSNDTQRAASFYEQNGDIITLPILENVVLVKQDFASRLENINPFAIFTFIGDVKLNPPADEWFEVNRRPDIVTNVEGNFTTVSTLAEKSGVLGTIWNAWQTQWSGTPVSSGVQRYEADRRWGDGGASLDNQFGLGPEASGWAHRVVTAEVFATQVGQSRTGVQTSIVTKVDRQVIADRVLSSAVIPYIRSRNLLIQVRGLKPSTRFYPFFDNIDVSAYSTPASKITYTAGSGEFDFEKNVGGLSAEAARRIAGDSQVCLNKGDVITGVTSNATAVVVGRETDPDTGSTALLVVNIIGIFLANEQITGSITNATGTVNSITAAAIGQSIVSNKNGDVNMLFNIPDTDSVRFRTGSREFKLVDNSVATGDYTSRGRTQYRAEGIVETRQSLVNAVRNAEIVQETVDSGINTIIETSQRVLSDTGWYDPLAQTFLVDNKGGAFLTKVDIFFATKDTQIPVTMEIREVVNGYPGKRVLPFSRVTMKPEQVNLSSNTVDLDGVATAKYDTATSFEFKSPVYVQDASEYCIVLISDSNKYKCWISQVGDTVPGTSRTISEQPYAGSLFKSQNASTWTTDQTQDLKFTIHRAKFDTSAVGTIQFVNDVLPYSKLDTDPFQTTTGSNIVRVWHRDHGLASGSKVIISGASGTLNGIPAAELNGTKTVSNIDLDSYTISSTTVATGTGYSGGTAIRATGQVQYDAVYPIAQVQSFSETSVTYGVKTTSGQSVDGTETPYVQDIGFGDCLANENNYFYSPRVVASEVNENTSMTGNKSVTFAVNFSSTNDSLSPVLDTQRMSLVAISNKINSPTHANTNVTPVDYTTLFSGATGAFTFSGSTLSSTDSAVRSLASTVAIGQYIRIAGSTTSGNSGTFLVTDVFDSGSAVTITVSGVTFTSESAITGTTVSTVNLFADEITPVGSSAASKYVTNVVKLALPSTFVKIRFAANVPSNSDVVVYYKTSLGSTGTLDKTKYTLATPVIPAVKVENGNETFYDVDYAITGMNPFDAIQVKLVMKSTNTSAIPRIKDLRIIACA